MTYWSDRFGFYVLGGLLCFILGGAFGTLTMKWASDGELRRLRVEVGAANHDARVCCDAAFVTMKFQKLQAERSGGQIVHGTTDGDSEASASEGHK